MAAKNHQPGASSGLRLGTILGAPVILAWSWFLAAIVITILFTPWLNQVRPDLGIGAWFVAFAYAVLLFASVFLHELAHGVAGQFYGQKVAAIELNIWGGFTRFEPQMDNPRDKAATTSFVISIVGPIVNIVLALLGWWALSAASPTSVPWLLLIAVTFANVALGAINLLPGIPLDGGWALQAIMWRITGSQYLGTIVASWVGRIIAIGFIGWSVITPLLAGRAPRTADGGLDVAHRDHAVVLRRRCRHPRQTGTEDGDLRPLPGHPAGDRGHLGCRPRRHPRLCEHARQREGAHPHRRPRPEGPALRSRRSARRRRPTRRDPRGRARR
jgi:Zn-dependent protease